MGTFDEHADRVLDVLLAHGGVYDEGEPGEVLANLADEASVPYKATSLVILRMEAWGWVSVDRYDERQARRANRIVRITVLE